ncbi:hypothetical protein BDZ94DRAFT_1314037 [Collybia nuda]|uniref:Uncharacterized protein n=1 Tax=Collybia nuda TaxID=64659 RepID=A0A9P5XU58_9AGAR|nr:hypothetical protein BDZ94DRAFT_1314037 [Collybia nuda]
MSSSNLALVFSRLIQGITYGIRDRSDTQFGKDWVNIVKDITGFLQVFIADIVLIYCCWVMYAYSRMVIVFPVFMWLGGTVCMALEIWSLISSHDFGTKPNDKQFAFDTGFWASTICLNLYATFGIILRIYNVEKANLKLGGLASALRQKPSRLQIVMCIINKSALMHTAATIIYFITLEIRDASANVMWAAVSFF